MKPRLRVALLAGGLSGEREVSLASAAQVEKSLNPERYTVRRYDPATDLRRLIAEAPELDLALIILHGRFGEDGTMQGLLDLLGLPYQGAGVLSSALCMDKRASKQCYRHHGLPVARDLVVTRHEPIDPERIVEALGLPVVVKPACEGSSLGLTIADNLDGLREGLGEAMACGPVALVEEYLTGREITGGVLGNDTLEALPLIEITPGETYKFFTYEAKYTPGASREICPAPLSDEETRRGQELAVRAHQALMCRGYSRTDMILTDSGQYYVLETNTLPGLTQTSLLPQAAAVAGYSFSDLMDRLVDLALEDHEASAPRR